MNPAPTPLRGLATETTVKAARAATVTLFLCTVTALFFNPARATSEKPLFETPSVDAVLDSLRQSGATQPTNWDDLYEQAGWDSAGAELWLPNSGSPLPKKTLAWRRFHHEYSPKIGFNKVDGPVSGVSLTTQWLKRPGIRLEGSILRSFSRGRYQGEAVASLQSDARHSLPYAWGSRVRQTGGGKEVQPSPFADRRNGSGRWAAFAGYSERSVPFGSNRPAANAATSLFLSLDGQDYLDRTEIFAGVRYVPSKSTRLEVIYMDRADRRIAHSREPHFNTDPQSWLNAPSQRWKGQGLSLTGAWLWRSRRIETTEGMWWKSTAWGAKLGHGQEFYTHGLEARSIVPVPGPGSLELAGWFTAVGGAAPLQELADLGGSSSLRGYPTRSQIGASSFVLQADYAFGIDPLAKTKIPILQRLRLQPIAFFDFGAAWGGAGSGWSSISDVTLPESQDWKSDVGIGVQKLVNYPGLLQRVRVDFAWRLDRSRERFRASFSVTR